MFPEAPREGGGLGGQGPGPRSPGVREPAAHSPVTHLTAHEETRAQRSGCLRIRWQSEGVQPGPGCWPSLGSPSLRAGPAEVQGHGERPLPLKVGSCGQGSRGLGSQQQAACWASTRHVTEGICQVGEGKGRWTDDGHAPCTHPARDAPTRSGSPLPEGTDDCEGPSSGAPAGEAEGLCSPRLFHLPFPDTPQQARTLLGVSFH